MVRMKSLDDFIAKKGNNSNSHEYPLSGFGLAQEK